MIYLYYDQVQTVDLPGPFPAEKELTHPPCSATFAGRIFQFSNRLLHSLFLHPTDRRKILWEECLLHRPLRVAPSLTRPLSRACVMQNSLPLRQSDMSSGQPLRVSTFGGPDAGGIRTARTSEFFSVKFSLFERRLAMCPFIHFSYEVCNRRGTSL